MFTLFHVLHDAVEYYALHGSATNWNDPIKFQVPENDYTFGMVFGTLPNTNDRELGEKRPKDLASDVIDLENTTCLMSKSNIYSTIGQAETSKWVWERVTISIRPHCASKCFGLKMQSIIEVGPLSDRHPMQKTKTNWTKLSL